MNSVRRTGLGRGAFTKAEIQAQADHLESDDYRAVVHVVGRKYDPCTGAERHGQIRVPREVARELLRRQEAGS